jgi:hypothetical protein
MLGPPQFYILTPDHVAVPVDQDTWARWVTTTDRQVARTAVAPDSLVSTVFLGLDHNWGDGPRQLFETMVFGGPLDQECVRYATWAQAEAGHQAMVAAVLAHRLLTGRDPPAGGRRPP